MNLGRITIHDPQSRRYVYPRRQPAAGQSVRHQMLTPNVDQFYTSGCVGFSGTNMLNCAAAWKSRQRFNLVYERRRTRSYLNDNDGLLNYSNSTKYDPFDWTFPPTDEGSSAIGLMKFWKQIGVISGYDWTFSFDAFLAALQHQPVLVGTDWYMSMNNPNVDGVVIPYGDNVGGHEYLATGVVWTRSRLIRFENSWGENWGDKGGFYMRFADVEQLLKNGGDVAVPRFL